MGLGPAFRLAAQLHRFVARSAFQALLRFRGALIGLSGARGKGALKQTAR